MGEDNFTIDFIGIGAMKSASTWVFSTLKEHPEICGSSKKEIHFFDKGYNYRKGLDYYKSFFEHCSGSKLKGEFTPGYIYYEDSAERIHKHFPNTKLIAVLRNPIERAYSHYRFAQRTQGRLSAYDSFEEAIEKSDVMIEKGLYYEQLKRYYELFPKENIKIKLFDELQDNPERLIQDIYNFLEVDDGFIPPSVRERKNVTGKKEMRPKIPFVNRIIFQIRNKISPQSFLFKFVDKLGLREATKKLLAANKRKEEKEKASPTKINEMSDESRKKLLEIYKEDVNKLEQLINKDLSHWKYE